jgi:hypothetical protein
MQLNIKDFDNKKQVLFLKVKLNLSYQPIGQKVS